MQNMATLTFKIFYTQEMLMLKERKKPNNLVVYIIINVKVGDLIYPWATENYSKLRQSVQPLVRCRWGVDLIYQIC